MIITKTPQNDHKICVTAAGSLSPETSTILVNGYWSGHDTSERLLVGYANGR